MTKHIPGPWVADKIDGAERCIRTTTYPQRTLAILDDGVVGHRNPENAFLMSAAPEMLELLEEFMTALDVNGLDDATRLGLDTVVVQARLVIEKAKGLGGM